MQLDINVSLIEKMKKYSDLEKGAHPILFAIESGCRYIEINIWVIYLHKKLLGRA